MAARGVCSFVGRAGGACPWATQREGGVRPSAYCVTIIPLGSVMDPPGPPQTLVAREAEVRQDAPDDAGILDRGDQAHAAATVRAGEHVHRKDPLEQLRPAPAPGRRSA